MHGDASTDNKTSNPPALDDRVSQFKTLVNQRGKGDRFYEHFTTQSVFALGLDVLDTAQDAGLRQEVITTLASEEGLSCIRHVASNRIPLALAAGTNEKVKLWETEACPLLRLAVHNAVVNSTLLEEKVAAIHSFIIGVGGTRLTAWFDLAVELAESPQLPSEVSCIGLAELSLLVLSTLLGSGTSQIVNDSFRHYSMRLSAVATNAEPSRPEDTFCKLQASQYADYIDRRLKIGEDIPGLRQATPSGPVQLSAFQLQRDLPGHLSADGPRHDNDHADITKISILPTPDEIRSTRSEYLPIADPTSWHHHGIRGRLDREFRLLREDTVGQLRDVVRTVLDNLQQNKDEGTALGPGPRSGQDSIQYCVYENVVVIDVGFEQRSGAEFLVRFRQPANRNRQNRVKPAEDSDASKKQRRDWWTFQAKKRLQPGGLVCAIDAQGSVNFFTVSDSTMRTSSDVRRWGQDKNTSQEMDSSSDPNQGIKYNLADDPQHAFVRLGFNGIEGQSQLAYGLSWFLKSRINRASAGRLRDGQQLRILVEFPGILLDSFLHTLRALQSGTEKLNIPMCDLIAPEQIDVEGANPQPKDVAPPKYAQKPGFVFDMSSLTAANEPLQHSIRRPLTSEEVCDKTKLDSTQSVALLEALSRSMALVQGPPGTGKTFAGVEILKVLLHNQKKAELGPIVIVCYTNHALDQILEHILDSGTPANILRMGGQSKSERLKNLNLRDAAHKVERTKVEKRMLWSSGETLKIMVNQLERLFGSLIVSTREDAIVRFLSRYDTEVYRELFGRRGAEDDSGDQDGFTIVNRHKPSAIIHRWRNGGDVEFGPAATGRRLSMLTLDERNTLYEKWQTESFTLIQDEIEHVYIDYVAAKRSLEKARQEADLRCLEAANIVGMTTTGLAKSHDLLKHIKSKVLLCEEAGEVLEAHMLTSFLPSIEHAILIGDHQQLRPQVQNYDLSIENRGGAQFAFDKSLFERLVSPRAGEAKIPFSTLSTQRRMHPSISALIRAPLYPSLEDGPNVHLYPEVTGMTRRLFWLDHQNWEDGAVGGYKSTEASGTSRTNEFEVEMTAALVSHLFKQGAYSGGDIAVLTPYLGQMMLLRRRLSSMLELTFNDRDAADLEAADGVGSEAEPTDRGDSAQADQLFVPAKTTLLNSVRVATVDNFQGEEAKVVVISLVRSNKNRQCGFLRTSNRINVLLSRARHGMYIIGNGDTCTGIPMWRDVMSALQCDNNMGPELPLQCPRHPERTFLASLPDHFVQFAPDGGCLQPCDKRLACGHSCIGRCHSDVIHAAVKCLEPCPRSLNGCIHACPRPCECGADDALDQEVDFITMATYRKINLGEDPCIFPVCGHILTMSSMDGIMDMAKHYTMTQDTSGLPRPVAIAASSSPFDMKEVKVCPHCRGSLRDVARYGRIVRRAVLDESTKRFINWARQKHNELALQLTGPKGQLEVDKEMEGKKAKRSVHQKAEQVYKKKFFAGKGRSALMAELLLSTDLARHHHQLAQTRNDISQFAAKVATDEQPFQRVAELVTFAHNRRRASGSEPAAPDPAPRHFEFDESVLQTGSSLQAAVLLMRCDILALEYVVFSLEKATSVDKLHARIRGGDGGCGGSSSSSSNNRTDTTSYTLAFQTVSKAIKTNRFTVLFKEFESTTEAAKLARYTKQEVEGYICSTHLCIVLSRLLDCIEEGVDAEHGEKEDEPSTARLVEADGPSAVLSRTKLKERATQHLAAARAVFQTSPSAHDLFGPEVDRLEQALENLAEYRPVTAAEMQAVYKAMASEFNGSGHWYTCVNGHPFTVGECGMPMEQARCNECGAPVGGRDHTNAEGVVVATEIEELGRGMNRMAVD
ncbi:nf-x1 finger and helicase domain containing protein [Sporothrix brasiliensis 5110]|uniref:Nf-x1 finger and helicase domain containing protein n=1 Tax=Sporothrix brasiliensis 5110 TaxID=1398154 RepID=A0A0C2IW76_9PEZI|nr:nf-x1 finger and helicase domain containing protein [Sporothrix brasiliensis 5110]KIH93411.1 nf-x1 finger and helicase domain containing protein [Sporothrix brasiliensis 5110]